MIPAHILQDIQLDLEDIMMYLYDNCREIQDAADLALRVSQIVDDIQFELATREVRVP